MAKVLYFDKQIWNFQSVLKARTFLKHIIQQHDKLDQTSQSS